MVFFAFEANIILNLQKQKALPEEIWYLTEKWGDMFTTVLWIDSCDAAMVTVRCEQGHGDNLSDVLLPGTYMFVASRGLKGQLDAVVIFDTGN